MLVSSNQAKNDLDNTYSFNNKITAKRDRVVHPDPPLLEAIQNFCYDEENPVTVRMLQVLLNPNNYELNWYESATGGLPLALDEPLEHLKL